jgi:hypothetical protein
MLLEPEYGVHGWRAWHDIMQRSMSGEREGDMEQEEDGILRCTKDVYISGMVKYQDEQRNKNKRALAVIA